MAQETEVEMWKRRAVFRHEEAEQLAKKVVDLQVLCRRLHVEYDQATITGATLCRALDNLSKLANAAGLVHRYCFMCGAADALDATTAPPGARSGSMICDECMSKHTHWDLATSEESEASK